MFFHYTVGFLHTEQLVPLGVGLVLLLLRIAAKRRRWLWGVFGFASAASIFALAVCTFHLLFLCITHPPDQLGSNIYPWRGLNILFALVYGVLLLFTYSDYIFRRGKHVDSSTALLKMLLEGICAFSLLVLFLGIGLVFREIWWRALGPLARQYELLYEWLEAAIFAAFFAWAAVVDGVATVVLLWQR